MTKITNKTNKQLERAEFQRQRILDAAEKCFIEHGFHAASMANISKAAEMSAGLIYRYFENKNAIILAIIDRQLDNMRDDFSNLGSGNDLITLMTDLLNNWKNGGPKGINPALYLEMAAHATRDPQIKLAMTKFDQMGTAIFSEWLLKNAAAEGKHLSPAEVLRCDFFAKCFIDGIAVRVVTEPALEIAFVEQSLRLLLPHILLLSNKPLDSAD